MLDQSFAALDAPQIRFIDRLVDFDSLPLGRGDGNEDDDKQA
jgi:hypothetical protein